MKTTSIWIQNLCVPCCCVCRYCLLHAQKKAEGVDYFRGKELAKRFVEWGRERQMSDLPYYYISYCAEYPELLDNIAFNRSVGFAGAKFLQCNGIKIRDRKETDSFVQALKSAGIEVIDATFYGDEPYHDAFAARTGDYGFMLRLAECTVNKGLICAPSLVITEENKDMLDGLLNVLAPITGLENIHTFIPDYRGRGHLVEDARLTKKSFDGLSDAVKGTLNSSRHKTEKEWLSMGELPEYTQRAVCITLREDNMDLLEKMSCDEIVAYVERLDDDYYHAVPAINDLARMYGDKTNTRLYRIRDLFWKWQKRFIEEHQIDLYNVTDERFCHTVRR